MIKVLWSHMIEVQAMKYYSLSKILHQIFHYLKFYHFLIHWVRKFLCHCNHGRIINSELSFLSPWHKAVFREVKRRTERVKRKNLEEKVVEIVEYQRRKPGNNIDKTKKLKKSKKGNQAQG